MTRRRKHTPKYKVPNDAPPGPSKWVVVLSIAFVVLVAGLTVRALVFKRTPARDLAVLGDVVERLAQPKAKPAVKKTPVPKPRRSPKAAVPKRAAEGPVLAVVLDDWGNRYAVFKEALAIRRPITLAILPHLPYSARIAREAKAAGLETILHMPMEPVSDAVDLEPETIRVSSDEATIRRYLDRALQNVPTVKGVNNHMGSAATADRRVMRAVLKHLKKKNLFYLDSNTSARSVVAEVAAETGIAFAERDVFLDNEDDKAAIKKQIRQAMRVAKNKGSCVAIGHDRKATLAALQEMVPEIESQGVRLVFLSELVG